MNLFRLHLIGALCFLGCVTASRAAGPFPTRENLLKPLGTEAEAALKKYAAQADPLQRKSLAEYMNGVVARIGRTVRLEAGEAEKLSVAAKDVVDASAKAWQPCVVASLRYLLPKYGDDRAQARRVLVWTPEQIVPGYTVAGWQLPDRTPAWQEALKTVLGEVRLDQWLKAEAKSRTELEAQTEKFLSGWSGRSREPMDEALHAKIESMKQVLKLPQPKVDVLTKLATDLVDRHIAAEVLACAELLASVLDTERVKIMAKPNAMANRFARPPEEALDKSWESIAGRLLGESAILAWKKGAAEQRLAEQKAAAPPAKLRWKNGETLPGEILDATQDALRWKAAGFADPLELKWSALHRIDQPLHSMATDEPFGFTLRDGSYLLGDLVQATDATITIRSGRHHEAVLKRGEVLSIRRLKGGSLISGGPAGGGNWSESTTVAPKSPAAGSTLPVTLPPAIPKVVAGLGGSLQMPYWNRGTAFEQSVADPSDIEIHLSSSIRPDFRLALEFTSGIHFDLETWDEDIVVAMADEFRFIQKLSADDRSVKLRICWDKTTRRCGIYTPEGRQILEWQTPDVKTDGAAKMVLMNKGRDLSMEFLRLRKWDGKEPPKFDLTRPRFELADGLVTQGELIRVSAGTLRVKLDGDSNEKDVPLSSVDALVLSADPIRPKQAEVTLNFADGTLLNGKMAAIKDGEVALQTSFADAPVSSRLDGLRQLMRELISPDGEAPETPLAELDKVNVNGISLHGRLVVKGGDRPRWLPVGGLASVSLSSDEVYDVMRAFKPGADIPAAPALFFTSSGDILPGSLHGMDRSGVVLDSEVVGCKALSADVLNAIEFGPATQKSVSGFKDPGWCFIKGDAKSAHLEGNSLRLDPNVAIGHASGLPDGEIKFSMVESGYTTLRVRLFCAGLDGSKSSNVMICQSNNIVTSGLETNDGNLANQTRTSVEPNKPLVVKIVVQGKSVELHLNGVLTQKFSIPLSSRQGVGLILEPGSVWGNRVNTVVLKDFSSRPVLGQIWLPQVSAEARRQTLTVPRFREDDPPRHAIIAGNGDVLRGEIEALTVGHYGFRTGLEMHSVPRDRVKAAIWLKKSVEGDSQPEEVSPAQKILGGQIQRRSRYSRASFSSLIGFIEREAPALKIKKPSKQDNRTFSCQFGAQTIGDALEQVCALFGLRYRLDKDDVVVIEAATTLPKGFVQKCYWLKPDAFSKGELAQDVLAAQGMPFPEGASAIWLPEARQLRVRNTAENQTKLVELIAAKFGGGLGSPTHWLVLGSGARLGLAVESFGPEIITGHHPVYGSCKVPVAQVYSISSSIPEPTALMHWQLIDSPEPVLPGTGGNSSPMLGKVAPTFKLSLLNGGDFDLSKEKGKIVVLDFWATWCGPCVKSLPGLIDAISTLPKDKVLLLGVNQGEASDVIKQFLEARILALTVAMDGTQAVARQYTVEGIPHTVIIGPDGKIAWVKTGYSPDGAAEAAAAVKKLLEP